MSQSNVLHNSFIIPLEENLFIRGDVEVAVGGDKKPVVILCHGFKGFKDWGFFPHTSNVLAEKGFAVIRFNFSCSGVNNTDFDELEKFSINTYSREQADLQALLNTLTTTTELPFTEHMDLSQIFLLGHSRGGGDSILFAAESSQIKGVISWNGISQVDIFDQSLKQQIKKAGIGFIENKRTKQQMPIRSIVLEDIKQNKERFDILSHLQHLQVPALFIQGAEDASRLIEGFHQMERTAPNQVFVQIDGANHTFGAVHPFKGTTPFLEQAINYTIHFLQQHTK
ncbi:alpha/beta hydrolase family protein [Ammoniphilus resinae]|uniref:Pimeloyl-ACP methyl ester carboxylesterase n=1 Tax=Ammoniphilus resinae TaxID=861532 RepID=A0ABS4GJW4_9BACL|nr:alpha/beta hydrolase [Ammoniphilus resinae]MBP1930551.1 pimeloyl-ACP methyl ester carboxylesterase [Ammoniphilus resinae]